MSKCCLHGDLTSVVRMHSLNTTNLSTISGNVGYLSDRYHLTTVLLASPGTAQIRDRWKRTTTKQKTKDVGRKLLGWKTNDDLIGETCDLSRIKWHIRERIISHWFLCVLSARHNWFDPAVLLYQQQQQQQLGMWKSNWPKQALTAHKNNISYCCLSVTKCRVQGRAGPEGWWWGSWPTKLEQWSYCDKGEKTSDMNRSIISIKIKYL